MGPLHETKQVSLSMGPLLEAKLKRSVEVRTHDKLMTTLSAGRWSERSDNLDDPNHSAIITPGGIATPRRCTGGSGSDGYCYNPLWSVIRILFIQTIFRHKKEHP